MPDELQTLLSPTSSVGPGNTLQAEAMRKILGAALFAGGIGAGARTLQGLGSFYDRNWNGPPSAPLHQSTIPIPVPVDEDDEPDPVHPALRVRRRAKLGAAPLARLGGELSAGLVKQGLLGQLPARLADWANLLKRPGETMSTAKSWASGWGNQEMADKPWVYPLGAAGIAGGLYGGYKLTDWLLDKTRKNEQESELEKAKQDYEAALMSQYPQKAASASDPLDQLYELAEKRAGWGSQALGLGLLGMGTIGVGSGLAAYQWGRNHSKTRALEEAIRRRQEALYAQSPRPIMAIPVPHAMGQEAVLPDEEEEALDERMKSGSLMTAADGVLQRLSAQKQQAMRHWQTLINGPEKPQKPQKPTGPVAPQLPTLAGAYSGQRPQPAPAG